MIMQRAFSGQALLCFLIFTKGGSLNVAPWLVQGSVEAELSNEEQWRNGKRLDQLYVSPSNPVVPELYDLGNRAEQEPDKQHSSQLDPQLLGTLGIQRHCHLCTYKSLLSNESIFLSIIKFASATLKRKRASSRLK